MTSFAQTDPQADPGYAPEARPPVEKGAQAPFWSFESIAEHAHGRWIVPPGSATHPPRGVCFDTRELRTGQVFVALAGERTDGHEHLARAAEAGASMAIVTRATGAPPGLPLLLVGDARVALARLASAWRDGLARRGVLVVAVTGSAGKTTTTRLVAAALGARWRGHHAPKSFNNSLGVPITLLNAGLDGSGHRFVVCEVGTSSHGEIAALGAIVRPDIGVITSIGTAHIEFLGSKAGIAREKAGLLHALRPGGVGVVPTESPELNCEVRVRPPIARLVTFGQSPNADVRLLDVRQHAEGLRFEVDGVGVIELPMLGAHNAGNAIAALAVARIAGLRDDEARVGLAAAQPPPMRLQPVRVGRVVFINDAYNANPESMAAAVRAVADLPPPSAEGRRVLVLGDMLELGEHAPRAHADLIDEHVAPRAAGFHLIIALGPAMSDAVAIASQRLARVGVAIEPRADDQAIGRVASLLRDGDLVLLKGSRGMRVERVLEARRASLLAPGEGSATPGVAQGAANLPRL